LLDIGRTLVKLGRAAEAAPYFSQALKLAARIGNDGLNARALLAYGQYCTAIEQYATAQTSLARALAYARRMDNRDLQVSACEALAQLQEVRGNQMEATRYWHEAANLLQTFAIPSTILDGRATEDPYHGKKSEQSAILAAKAQAEELRELRGLARTQEALLRNIRVQLADLEGATANRRAEIFLALTQLIDNHLRDGAVDSGMRKVLEDVDSEFIQSLRLRYPNLTASELQICSFLALGYDNLKIVKLFARSLRTVQNHRLSIRKKMKLTRSQDLQTELKRMR
jgi:DNA-binding CsgD family transcriptional regulator